MFIIYNIYMMKINNMDIKFYRDKFCYFDCGKIYGIYRNLCNDREKSLINKIYIDRIILKRYKLNVFNYFLYI